MKESEASRGILQWTLDLLAIQNYVIKKGRPHGHRFGKTQEQKDLHIAHISRKICIMRNFVGIHDRFVKDPVFRESQLKIDRTDRSLYPDGQGRAERFHLSNDARRVLSIQKELVDLSQ